MEINSNKTVTACLIVIGDEVLSGRTIDANINFIAGELTDLGVRLMECRVLPDDEDEIVAAVNSARAKFDYVFTTGGIGATHDDITAAAISKAFGVACVVHPVAEKLLLKYFGERANTSRMRMAIMPEGATLIDNPVSIAPGFQVENVYVLAGVPMIAKAMFESLKANLRGGDKVLSRTLSTIDKTEGDMAEVLGRVQEQHQNVSIGSYPFLKMGGFGVNLVVRGTNISEIDAACTAIQAMIRALGGTPLDLETTGE